MKKIVSLLLTALMLFSFTAAANDYVCKEVFYPIYIEDALLSTGSLPILNLNGSTYIPLRKIGEGSGLSVDWIADKQEIRITNLSDSSEHLSKLYALGIDILNETSLLQELTDKSVRLCLSTANYIDHNSEVKLIEYLINHKDRYIPQQIEEIEYLINFYITEYRNKERVPGVSKEILNFDPENCLLQSKKAQQKLNQIIDATIGYLNNIYTYEYYISTYDVCISDFDACIDEANKYFKEKYTLKSKLYANSK